MTSTDLVLYAGGAPMRVGAPGDAQLIEAFMASPRQAYQSLRTRQARAQRLRKFARSLPCPMVEATEAHVATWLDRGLAPATRVNVLTHLHAFYGWACQEGLVERSPTAAFRGRGGAELRLAPVPHPIRSEPGQVAVALAQVAPGVELFRVTMDVGLCQGCGDQTTRLRRLGGVGQPLCSLCYQTAKRAARKAGEALRVAARRTTAADLHRELTAAGLAPRSIKLYCRTIWNAERWFDERDWSLARATPEQIAAYADTLPLTHSSRLNLRCALSHYWRICEHPRPPRGAIRVPAPPAGLSLALDEDAARRLATAARARGDRPGLVVVLGLYAGLRREELATLPWSAFDEPGCLQVTGKGSKTRRIPLHPAIVEALATVPRSDELYVFPGRRVGSPVSNATIWAWVRLVADEAGVARIPPHVLRHTCLSAANDATGDLRAVQALAGHAKPETTSRYTRASNRRLVAAVMALDY